MARNHIGIACALTLAGLAFPQASLANTMTFSGLSPAGVTALPYDEDGITAFAGAFGGFGYYITPGTAHLDATAASGSPFASSVPFTMASPFDFVSIDVLGLGTAYYHNSVNIPYDNVLFEGYRSGSLVAQANYSTGITSTTFNVTNALLGGGFVDLDEFRVTALVPSVLNADFECTVFPCGHFSIDNLVLNPVPLPAALPMLLIGIGSLVAAGVGLRTRA